MILNAKEYSVNWKKDREVFLYIYGKKRIGKPFNVAVTFELKEFEGNKMWGIEPHFEPRKDPSSYTRADAPFKPEFLGYTLTKKEIQDVRAGGKVMITATSKKGKSFDCNVSLELKEFKGNKFWGLEAHFA
ncbi:hypothetical protein EH196_03605 [Bacillus sp. C1-1]|nr:hypothetical protein EH196_03605 [Bacillus sp. C1-1]